MEKDKQNQVEVHRPGLVAKVGRDPVALAAIAIVVAQLFTKITVDMALSVALVALIVIASARRGAN